MSTKTVCGQKIDPESRTQFVMIEGRYYSFMAFITLPKRLSAFGKGGDINGLLWRKDENPEEWFWQFRFRHYQDSVSFDSNDTKTWYFVTLKANTEEAARAEAQEFLNMVATSAALPVFGGEPLKVEYMEVHGDVLKFMNIVQNNPPPWMHSQQVVQE